MKTQHVPLLSIVGLAAVLAVASPAWAASPQDQAAAEVLFQEGKRLAEAGDWQNACPKFLESQRLDAGAGTLLNLGDCYEKTGKLASAWGAFTEAGLTAVNAADHNGRAIEAARRAKLLEPRLSRLAIVVPPSARVPGLRVTRDGETVGEGQWGSPLPLDAGDHVVEASAPGRRTWTSTLKIAGAGASTTEVPPLAEGPSPPLLSTTSPASGWGSQRSAGIVVASTGLAAILVGGILGGVSIARKNSLEKTADCTPGNPYVCNAAGVTLHDQALAMANASNVTLAVGGAALVTGAALFFTAKSDAALEIRAAPVLTAETRGVCVMGRW
jgi:hypothetical protein